jgi:hypothetical protein
MDGVFSNRDDDDIIMGHEIDRREDLVLQRLRRQSTYGEMVKLKSKIIKGKSDPNEQPRLQ